MFESFEGQVTLVHTSGVSESTWTVEFVHEDYRTPIWRCRNFISIKDLENFITCNDQITLKFTIYKEPDLSQDALDSDEQLLDEINDIIMEEDEQIKQANC